MSIIARCGIALALTTGAFAGYHRWSPRQEIVGTDSTPKHRVLFASVRDYLICTKCDVITTEPYAEVGIDEIPLYRTTALIFRSVAILDHSVPFDGFERHPVKWKKQLTSESSWTDTVVRLFHLWSLPFPPH